MKNCILTFVFVCLLLVFVITPAIAQEIHSVTPAETTVTTTETAGTTTETAGTPNETPGTPPETPPPGATPQPALNVGIAIAWAAVGVFVSFIIPVLTKYRVQVDARILRNEAVDRSKEFVKAATPYVVTAIQSFLIAIIVIAIILNQGTVLNQWYEALIAGYTFDATIQKVKPQ